MKGYIDFLLFYCVFSIQVYSNQLSTVRIFFNIISQSWNVNASQIKYTVYSIAATGTAQGILIKLHGLVQTDDRLALREITRQLRLEECADARQFGSFAGDISLLLCCLVACKDTQEFLQANIFLPWFNSS